MTGRKWLLLASLFFLTSNTYAMNISGRLDLKAPLFIQTELPPGCTPDSNNPICADPIQDTLPPAVYGLTLNSGRHETSMTIQGADRRSTWRLKTPQNQQIPRTGSFQWSARQIGQEWDVFGNVEFAESNSQPQDGYEPCSEIRYRDVWVCDRYGRDRGPGRRPPPRPRPERCRWETESYIVYGDRYVRFYYHTEQTDLTFDILDGGRTLGRFAGRNVSNEKIYTEQGRCLIR